MNKRGLNQIVTVVLIVLLILVAIFILWLSLRSSVSERTEEAADITANCFTLNLQPTSCVYQENSGGDVSVKIERGSGTSDVRGLKLVFVMGSVSEVVDWVVDISELGTVTRLFSPSEIGFDEPDRVSVTAAVGDSEALCDAAVAGGEIECVALPNCELDSAEWIATQPVIEGETVQMRVSAVNGDDCTNDHDVVFNIEDDSGNVVDTAGSSSWNNGEINVNYGTDGLGGDYTFTAYLEINPSEGVTSGNLNVQQCELSSAVWGQDEAGQNENVDMIVSGNAACEGKDIRFEVLSENQQGEIVYSIESPLTSGQAMNTWNTGFETTTGSYVINASVVTNPDESVLSDILLVFENLVVGVDCDTPLDVPDTLYRLSGNIVTSGGSDCFLIEANSIILDGNGYNVTSNDQGTGVDGGNLFNVTVINLGIKSFSKGIDLAGVTNSLVKNNLVESNGLFGIHLWSSSERTTVSDNIVRLNSDDGIFVQSNSVENIIKNNFVQSNSGDGILLSNGCDGNILENNIISSNSGDGISLSGADSNVLLNNNVQGGLSEGIAITTDSSGNILSGNNLLNNRNGILLSGDTNSNTIQHGRITGNQAGGSNRYGIRIATGANNVLRNLTLENPNGRAIELRFNSPSNTLDDVKISGTNPLFDDLYIDYTVGGGAGGAPNADNTLIKDTNIGRYDFILGDKIFFENSAAGRIEFTEDIIGSGNNLASEVNIIANQITISSNFDYEGTAYLYGSLANGNEDAEILRNGGTCGGCSLVGNSEITDPTVIFTVPGEGTYSIG